MTRLSAGQATKLMAIVKATQSPDGFVYMTPANVKVLVDGGYAECNNGMTNPDNPKEVAVRATETGVNYSPASGAIEPAAQPEGTKTVENSPFAIIDNVTVPPIKRNSGGSSQYPFDALQVGQGFFVPATDAMPNPGTSLASTVSSASKRYAIENGTRTINRKATAETAEAMGVAVGEMGKVEVTAYAYHRKFVVRGVEDGKDYGQPGVKGAIVTRIAVGGGAE